MGPSLKTESPNYPKKPGQITDIPKPELHTVRAFWVGCREKYNTTSFEVTDPAEFGSYKFAHP